MTKPRLQDIAARLGVSSATVSRALSGKGYVSDELAGRIRAMAYELNYALPETDFARKALLVASQSAMVDLQRSQFSLYVIEGLKARAERLGIEIETCTFRTESDLEALRERVEPEGLMGMLFLTVEDETLPLIRSFPCPVILVNGDDPEMKLSSVTPCNRSAASLAVRHLLSLGHEEILFLTKPGRRTVLRRLEGVKDVLGARFDPDLVVTAADWTVEAGREAVIQAIAEGKSFSAVLAAGDILAVGATLGLQARGRNVPGDVSVMGIDALPQGEFLSPPLTTVSVPMGAIGAQAIDLLNQIFKLRGGADPTPARRVELACALLDRSSTAKNVQR